MLAYPSQTRSNWRDDPSQSLTCGMRAPQCASLFQKTWTQSGAQTVFTEVLAEFGASGSVRMSSHFVRRCKNARGRSPVPELYLSYPRPHKHLRKGTLPVLDPGRDPPREKKKKWDRCTPSPSQVGNKLRQPAESEKLSSQQ